MLCLKYSASARTKPTPPTSPKGEALCIGHFISADEPFAHKNPREESSPLGEDARRAEEVTTPPRSRTVTPAATPAVLGHYRDTPRCGAVYRARNNFPVALFVLAQIRIFL